MPRSSRRKAGGPAFSAAVRWLTADHPAGCFEDPFGHQWWLAQHVQDLTPEEIKKAAESHFSQMQPAS